MMTITSAETETAPAPATATCCSSAGDDYRCSVEKNHSKRQRQNHHICYDCGVTDTKVYNDPYFYFSHHADADDDDDDDDDSFFTRYNEKCPFLSKQKRSGDVISTILSQLVPLWIMMMTLLLFTTVSATSFHRHNRNQLPSVISFSTTTTMFIHQKRHQRPQNRLDSTSSPAPQETEQKQQKKQQQQKFDQQQDKSQPTKTKHQQPDIIPVTVVSGFLGSGKTTLLQNMLSNTIGLRIAVIVNDVASINIDSKLLLSSSSSLSSFGQQQQEQQQRQQQLKDGRVQIMELQNGCACCSRSDELLSSLAELITLNDMRLSASTESEVEVDSGSLYDNDNNNNNNNDHHHQQTSTSSFFDHIVIEMSGVADPASVRAIFHDAIMYDMPLMSRIRLDTMITLIDVTTYLHYMTNHRDDNQLVEALTESSETIDSDKNHDINNMIPPALRANLGLLKDESYHVDNDNHDDDEDLYEATYDNNNDDSYYYNDNEAQLDSGDGDVDGRGMVELLTSQTEIADVVVLNKIDLLLETQQLELNTIQDLVCAINPKATIIQTSYGMVPIDSILAVAKGNGVAMSGIVDDHREIIQAAKLAASSTTGSNPSAVMLQLQQQQQQQQQQQPHESSNHDHDHSHGDGVNCTPWESISSTSDCSHDEHNNDSNNDNCSKGVICTDPTHDHSHEHHHHHHHQEDTIAGTTTDHAGIGTYVYSARRPFHPQRLLERVLWNLPVQRGIPLRPKYSNEKVKEDKTMSLSKQLPNVLQNVIRSKGFTWFANTHAAALYWSQAGTSFEVICLGSWWATLPRNLWPSYAYESILQDFDDPNHNDINDTNQNDNDLITNDKNHGDRDSADCGTFTSVGITDGDDSGAIITVGDRRQELVFIGPTIGDPKNQRVLQHALDQCLLTDEEWGVYISNLMNENILTEIFPNSHNDDNNNKNVAIPIRMVS